jgi:hypothetical protein
MAFARKKAPETFSIEDMALEELIEAVHKWITALIDESRRGLGCSKRNGRRPSRRRRRTLPSW